MRDLALDERLTLELVAEAGEHTVLEAAPLMRLEEHGLVSLSEEGWDVTPLGRFAVALNHDR